ncbi:MAG TPA: bifunctional riboflavin kinase/FAD synthetase [Nevskiaceae bacterium]|nr:bifunctional riboflavin kinase/FAD synthetase [Nevskiaceae bacterium]
MELVRGVHNLRDRHRGCVLTIGNFDGVHLGHQALIARTRELAKKFSVPSALLTFEPLPREFFAKDRTSPRVSTFRGKLCAIEEQGIDRVILQRFGPAFASWSAERFVEELLVDKLGVRAVGIGDDFRFGAQRRGDFAMLEQLGERHGFEAHHIDTVARDGMRCSSSALREALTKPDLALAAKMLGRPYRVIGHVRRGLQLGRKLGMPTVNIFLHRSLALRLGVYVVRARIGERQWNGVANIGVRPTLGFTRCLLETHLFGDPGQLYGSIMEVEFHRWLREERKFDSLELLAEQMQRDKADAVKYWSAHV